MSIMKYFSKQGNAIDEILKEDRKYFLLLESTNEQHDHTKAKVRQLEDGGAGRELKAAKKFSWELEQDQTSYSEKLEEIFEHLWHEDLEIIRKNRFEIPQIVHGQETERRQGAEKAAEMLAQCMFLLESYYKTSGMPLKIEKDEHPSEHGKELNFSWFWEAFNRVKAHCPKNDPETASFPQRRQEVINLQLRGVESDIEEAKTLARKQIAASRSEI